MTHQEMIDVIEHHMNGGEVEYWNNQEWEVVNEPCWDFNNCEYRKKPEASKRLLTVKEIWGKTLIAEDGVMETVSATSYNDQIWMEYLDSYTSIADLRDRGFKLAGPDLNYETATSLEVDA